MCVMRMRRARLCPHTLTHTGRPPCCSADRQRACTPAPPDPAGRSRARRRPPPATAPPPTRPTAPQAARAPPSPLPPAARGCRLLASPPPFAAARSGPVRHRRSRPIDPSLGALSTPVLTSRTAGHAQRARGAPARGPRTPLLPPSRPAPARWSTRSPRTMEDRGSRLFFAGLQHAVTVLIRNDSNKYYTHIT
jgi:hypothetical protein